MQDAEFDFITSIIKQRSGITLTKDKLYLLESRLQPIARAKGLENISALIQQLRMGPNSALMTEVIEAITTNESMFFRDMKPFEQLRNVVLPEVIKAAGSKRKLRIWSAACSNGQEPYSAAITLLENAAAMVGWSHEILATDLANKVLEKAKSGLYTQFEVQRGLPIQLLIKYFQQEADNHWRVKDSLRSMVEFKPHNLLLTPEGLGKFDIIFCRNVLIYFDEHTKSVVFNHLRSAIHDHGFLYLGSAETIIGLTDKFKAHPSERGLFTPI